MNIEGYCETGKQKCPTPYLCQTGCYFTETTDTVPKFWDASQPGYYEALDAPANLWDKCGAVGKCFIVIAAVFVCMVLATILVWGLV